MIKSNIEWTNATQNFWMGCHKVSAGCKYCYMHRILDGDQGKGNGDRIRRTSDANFYQPLSWKEGKWIFTCSMSDFFLEEADKWRADAWRVIKGTPQHKWLILTKRPERILKCLPDDWEEGYPNVALGVSVENQAAFERVKILSKIPAKVRFISAEPLLEDVDLLLTDDMDERYIDKFRWVIIGGESGNETGPHRYRPCKISWISRMVKDLKSTGRIAVFVKQLGTYQAKTNGLRNTHGANISEFPPELRIREFPTKNKRMA
ncbi:MAG TPA: DUF5131 family protein [Bacteroidia bacterium]|jgi:protein gp37|nr:DUF5131 family protein [Bacteroidia bacterium]